LWGKKLHEAIMREDSNEYEEGIVIEEFRKGFKLGDRLLRPSMVKVSAGPGPVKPDQVESWKGMIQATLLRRRALLYQILPEFTNKNNLHSIL
jgi:hypothetical protein